MQENRSFIAHLIKHCLTKEAIDAPFTMFLNLYKESLIQNSCCACEHVCLLVSMETTLLAVVWSLALIIHWDCQGAFKTISITIPPCIVTRLPSWTVFPIQEFLLKELRRFCWVSAEIYPYEELVRNFSEFWLPISQALFPDLWSKAYNLFFQWNVDIPLDLLPR